MSSLLSLKSKWNWKKKKRRKEKKSKCWMGTKWLDKSSVRHQRDSLIHNITLVSFLKRSLKDKYVFLGHLCYIGVQFPWHTSCQSPIVCELIQCSHCPEATSPATGKPHGDYQPKIGLKDSQTQEATSWYCHNHSSWFSNECKESNFLNTLCM